MTVGELKKIVDKLAKHDPDMEVMLYYNSVADTTTLLAMEDDITPHNIKVFVEKK